jgi:hypothetical protein
MGRACSAHGARPQIIFRTFRSFPALRICSFLFTHSMYRISPSASKGPNLIVAEWLELLLRIREVPGSKLGPESGYPE